ncbi:unnamed protein product [Schistosoma rodhaini]|uniref:Mitochondrial fission regulator 2 n=1 Tax=Schistosoma rodhaini TaxID=6188 RepID=A0AA85GE66_9TREM|nr:unnamed protein product [Schistosoma rodhaini]
MTTYPLNMMLQHLLTYVRSFCSVRYIVKFLPNGSLAPRLNIDSNVLLSKNSEYDDCDCSASDSNVLYTSSYTDPINSNDDDSYNEPNRNSHLTSLPCYNDNRDTVSSSFSIFNSHKNFKNYQESNVPVYYVGSFSNIYTSLPDSEIKSIKNITGDNNDQKLIMKSNKTQYSNYRYRGKNKRGKRLKESTKNNGKLYHNNNTSDTTDSSDEHFHSSSRSNRISQLEAEISRLRSQIAQLISAQELGESSTCDLGRDRFPHRPDADGESDTAIAATGSPSLMEHDETKFNNNLLESNIPSASLISTSLILPPPPPPPPMISSPALQGGANGSSNWREQLQARLRSKKNNCTDKTSTPIKSNLSISQNPADMSQVLKELQSGSIKLRSIPRSPGGTPIKQKRSPTISGSDPCAIIARALHSKFSHLRSMMDNSTSGEEKSQSDNHLDSGLGPGREDIWSPKRKPNGSPHSLIFGQHILRPVNRRPDKAN